MRLSGITLVVGLSCLAIGLADAGRTVLAADRPIDLSTSTQEHLRSAEWWPTRPAASPSQYAGTAACARCHAEIVASQGTSQMAHTLVRASASTVLPQSKESRYQSGPYTYTVQQKGKAWTVAVTDGAATREAPIDWAFGSGDVGQSYLWQANGGYGESRFNYFSTLHGFGATPGRLHGSPTSLDHALGRKVEGFEARTCFSCHTTSMSAAEPLDTRSIVPGVGCESCHGPGAEHIAAMSARPAGAPAHMDTHIVNGKRMSPAKAVDMCGACHSTPWDVRIMGAVGVQTVRFPAYRLEKSRCWGTSGDARITCTACHDPHEPLERNPVAYDSACLDCHVKKGEAHADAQRPGAACPVAVSKCVTCHMPRVEVPEMHYKFTDHMIRVARNNAPFPD